MTQFARFGEVAIVAAVIFLVGCKPTNPNAPVKVSGKVTYNGSTVPGGTVNFYMKDGSSIVATAGIQSDGSYSITDMPEGDFLVTVETESINPEKKKQEYRGGTDPMAGKYGKTIGGGGAPKAGKGKGMELSPAPEGASQTTSYVKIPGKYAKPDTSGLSVNLKKGEQKFNAELTD